MGASGYLSDVHPWRHILVLLKHSIAALFLSQQPRIGNQQMENKLYICLEDIRFSPALTELFLFIYPPSPKGKVFCSKAGGKSCYHQNKAPSSQWIPEGLDVVWSCEMLRARYSPDAQ